MVIMEFVAKEELCSKYFPILFYGVDFWKSWGWYSGGFKEVDLVVSSKLIDLLAFVLQSQQLIYRFRHQFDRRDRIVMDI